jgi:hypothetical protein
MLASVPPSTTGNRPLRRPFVDLSFRPSALRLLRRWLVSRAAAHAQLRPWPQPLPFIFCLLEGECRPAGDDAALPVLDSVNNLAPGAEAGGFACFIKSACL